MVVSFQSLFASALPPGPLVTSTEAGVSTNSLLPQSTFSSALDSAIQQTNPASAPAVNSNPANTSAVVPGTQSLPGAIPLAPTGVAAPVLTGNFGEAIDVVLSSTVAITAVPTDAASAAIPTTIAADVPATPIAVTQTVVPVPVPNLPLSEQDTSRTQQLRFQFSGATRGPRTAVPTPTALSTPAASATRSPASKPDTAISDAASPVSSTLPSIPQATVADSARIASQVQATALTNPQVVDRGFALPAAPPQLGYGTERPPVLAAVETTAAPPVASGNRPGATADRVGAAQIAFEQLRPAPVPVSKGFTPILASATAEAPVAPAPKPILAAATPPLATASTPTAATAPVTTTATSIAAAIPKTTTPIPAAPAPPTTSLPTPIAPQVRVETAPSLPTVSIVRITPAVPGADLPLPSRDLDAPATNSVVPQTLPTVSSAGPSAVERPTPGVKTDVPSAPEQIAQSVVSQVRVLNKDETVEYSIRLDPPDLGRVQIRLVSTGDNLSAHVTVATDAVRQMMESQLPELRQRLEQAGVNATQIDVNTQTAGQQAGSGDRDSRWQDARQEYPFFRPPDLPPVLTRSWVAVGSAGSGRRLDVTA